MASIHIAVVLGTRPEAIKLAPVILAAQAQPDRFTTRIIATGQHRQMAREALDAFGLVPDVDLSVMQDHQRPTDVLSRILWTLPGIFSAARPSVVLVQGDTTSTLAGALAAFHAKIPVGHVEAGLRTTDPYQPFPEEMNRRLVTQLATYHFAPTETSRARLVRENIPPWSVVVTGNTVVDAMTRLRGSGQAPRGVSVPAGSRVVLLTCHRRENHGAPLREVCAAVRELIDARQDLVVVCPVHPNPEVQAVVQHELGTTPRVQVVPPLGYAELLWLLDASTIVLTDSGGLQEEAPAYHKPVLVLRDVTERPEGVEAGVARLIGTSRAAIVREALRLLDDRQAYAAMVRDVNPYGDGHAAERILDALAAAQDSGRPIEEMSAAS